MRITVYGAGSWGTALAFVLGRGGHEVFLHGRREAEIREIARARENKRYLPGVILPAAIKPTADKDCLCQSDAVVLSVPSHAVREASVYLRGFLPAGRIVVNTAKGLEEGTHLRLSEVIKSELPGHPVAALSGPSHAEEVGREVPTTVVSAAATAEVAEAVQEMLMTENFRVYTNLDIIGVELGGALKNIIALCSGAIEGMVSRDNTKAALITRGAAEMARLGVALGGERATFFGLAGIGDLIVTCMSAHSRNLRAGRLLGAGIPLAQALAEIGMVVEGVRNTKVAYELSQAQGVEMPITEQAYKVVFEGLPAEEALKTLMRRDRKHEREELPGAGR
ncbi:MAG: NAD(P)H-dependent glycerol-3-phosphate dehydrogenase [Gracilibacteraceae bacterium]|jgi:glycerol-3-phosphate dehydrogenase (NAD(P)+)|nr:NAD(P)H-dependent glycerol-3-phosphate dehydrogenase [Gracilibacteraceae bacterium]